MWTPENRSHYERKGLRYRLTLRMPNGLWSSRISGLPSGVGVRARRTCARSRTRSSIFSGRAVSGERCRRTFRREPRGIFLTPAARRRMALAVARRHLPQSQGGRPHRLGRGDNHCCGQHRRPARDRRPAHRPLGSRGLLIGLLKSLKGRGRSERASAACKSARNSSKSTTTAAQQITRRRQRLQSLLPNQRTRLSRHHRPRLPSDKLNQPRLIGVSTFGL
jgi:hypothetical protein